MWKILSTLLILCSCALNAQNTASVSGNIIDFESKKPVEIVTVYIDGTTVSTESNIEGFFQINIPAEEEVNLVFSRLGYREEKVLIKSIPPGITRKIIVKLLPEDSDVEVTITDNRIEDLGMIRETTEALTLLPTTTGNLESVLPSIALGTSGGSGGELSSQYNVRGGNYDENLIYINDFEIFRPQLIRSGQQEGLTFPNPDLIRDLSFSSGGFEAKYGDKLSSVLDVRYKRAEESKQSISFSLLGASAHLEGKQSIAGKPFRYLLGGRYKTSKYLLGSLDLKGEYQPNHGDVQAYLTYDLSNRWQVELLTNYNISRYNFVPKSGTSNVGTFGETIQLYTEYEGSEKDQFQNTMAGLGFTYLSNKTKNPYFLKFMAAAYSSIESESLDILGHYRLAQIETSLGADNAGEEIALLGTGTQHNNARNNLNSVIANVQHRGGIELQPTNKQNQTHFIQWSVQWQHENLNDNLKEFERLDSAGYSIPYSPSELELQYFLRTKNSIQSDRIMVFGQETFTIQNEKHEVKINAGVRMNYWSFNKELNITPRAQILYKPLSWTKDFSFKLAGGLYYQPPFYRELRKLDGTINYDIKSQKSAHAVVGFTYDFPWKRVSNSPFKLITELYYKPLWDVIPYDIDNVRIRYTGENNATGYAVGLDARINGEFVDGAESWVNFSILRTREAWEGIEHLEYRDTSLVVAKDVPRPSDQIFTMNMFFQDYLPRNDKFKAHLNLSYGSGIAFGIKGDNVIYRNQRRFTSYKRVDIGFSYALWNRDWLASKPNHPLRWTRNAWMSFEVFNLLGISNVASYTWIKSIYNVQYGIPNRLTSRRVNLKFRFEF